MTIKCINLKYPNWGDAIKRNFSLAGLKSSEAIAALRSIKCDPKVLSSLEAAEWMIKDKSLIYKFLDFLKL